jgi:hypothetical protein
MNVYLLPHHPLDPRFRYTLEREPSPTAPTAARDSSDETGPMRRWLRRTRELVRRLKHDYDHIVHGHEQMRLSRLLLLMDRDPELTLVIPAALSREAAMEALRGVIRVGLMGQRSHAIRNVVTALVMMIILFGIIPTHFAAVLFYPLIFLYAWLRYWEDRLIRKTLQHLLDVRLATDGAERFREEAHLARIEELFAGVPRPGAAYKAAIEYLDGLDQRIDGRAAPEHMLLFNYYSDIGAIDPYERYQDRIRKKLLESLKLAAHHLWLFWKGVFRWAFDRTQVGGLRLPNWTFVVATLIVLVSVVWGVAVVWHNKLSAPSVPQQSSAMPPVV